MNLVLTITAIIFTLAAIWFWVRSWFFPPPEIISPDILIEPFELAKLILNEVIYDEGGDGNSTVGLKNTRLFDCSMGKDKEFQEKSIPFSEFLDVEHTLTNSSGVYPNTYPTGHIVRKRMEELGVEMGNTIICYNQAGKIGAGRVYHILTTYGFKHVRVLNGDLGYWEKIGLPVVPGVELNYTKSSLHKLKFNHRTLVDLEQVYSASIGADETLQLIDVRDPEMFNGTKNNDELACRPGHICNAINIPLAEFKHEGGRYKSAIEILDVLMRHHVDLTKDIATYCFTGIASSEAYLALRIAKYEEVVLYDGSWSEFG
jgi:thiosulfate/3-mercaptopyruvate sulfurtransferase